MEGYHTDQYWFWMKRRQILTSNLQLQTSNGNKNNSWEERAFAEDAARNILNGSIWPPRSYSCNFCKREFRSAQALGGHMNIHRRDRARLKQNHDQESLFDHQKKNINNDFGNHYFSSKIMSSHIDSYNHFQIIKPCSTRRRSLSPSRMISSSSSSSLHNDCVETSLSLGLTSMFGQKTSSSSNVVPCEEKVKKLKTTNNISSLHSVFFKTCSNDHHHHHGMEDLDLELRLGKQQKVK